MNKLLLFFSLAAFSVQAQTVTLKQQAAAKGLLFGAAVATFFQDAKTHLKTHPLKDDPAYSAKIKEEFSVITPEGALKFLSTEPDKEGQYKFDEADQILDLATANNMFVRGHALVWHKRLPVWLTSGSFTKHELTRILHQHIKNVVSYCSKKYPGRIIAWDVVNEAIDDNGKLRDKPESIWAGIGTEPKDYIRHAYKWAHEAVQSAYEADPDKANHQQAKLFYNEYGIYDLGTKSNAVYDLIKELKNEGVPIDGIGFQTHLRQLEPGQKRDWDGFKKNMERFAALGLEVDITEFDYALKLPVTAAAIEEQKDAYAKVVEMCLTVPACHLMVTWGFTDKYSWIPEHTNGIYGAALYFDESFKPKPAYDSLISALKK